MQTLLCRFSNLSVSHDTLAYMYVTLY